MPFYKFDKKLPVYKRESSQKAKVGAILNLEELREKTIMNALLNDGIFRNGEMHSFYENLTIMALKANPNEVDANSAIDKAVHNYVQTLPREKEYRMLPTSKIFGILKKDFEQKEGPAKYLKNKSTLGI